MKTIEAIKKFFETGKHGRRITMEELKALPLQDRKELGKLAAEALEEPFEG